MRLTLVGLASATEITSESCTLVGLTSATEITSESCALVRLNSANEIFHYDEPNGIQKIGFSI